MKIFLIIIDIAMMALNIYLGATNIGKWTCAVNFFAAGVCAMSALSVAVTGD